MPQAQPELKKVCSKSLNFALNFILEDRRLTCTSTSTSGCLCNSTAVGKLLVFYEDTMLVLKDKGIMLWGYRTLTKVEGFLEHSARRRSRGESGRGESADWDGGMFTLCGP